jgi:predicted  nucleic acid-binding Zn-ribbon protein
VKVQLSDEQFNAILFELKVLQAGNNALKSQVAELHGRLNKTLDKVDELQQRISFNLRPKS